MELTPFDNEKILTAKRWLLGFHQECWREKWGGKDFPWENFYVAGGAIASLLQGETPKDVDIYCDSDSVSKKMMQELITIHRKDIKETKEYREFYAEDGKMVSEWAVTMKNGASFIFKNAGKPSEIKKSFDYVHTTAHYQFLTIDREPVLFISPLAYHCAVNKLLIVNNKVTMTIGRRDKFINRGYTP
jgi:hypothetical protein